MKNILQVFAAALLCLLQVIFLPLNFALLATLIMVLREDFETSLITAVSASFFLSIFGNLNFGLTLASFSLSMIVFLLMRRFLPDRKIVIMVGTAFTLIFWEFLLRTTSIIYLGSL